MDTAATTTTTTKSNGRGRSARTSFRTPTEAGAWIVLRHGVEGLRTALGTEGKAYCSSSVVNWEPLVDGNMNADHSALG